MKCKVYEVGAGSGKMMDGVYVLYAKEYVVVQVAECWEHPGPPPLYSYYLRTYCRSSEQKRPKGKLFPRTGRAHEGVGLMDSIPVGLEDGGWQKSRERFVGRISRDQTINRQFRWLIVASPWPGIKFD